LSVVVQQFLSHTGMTRDALLTMKHSTRSQQGGWDG